MKPSRLLLPALLASSITHSTTYAATYADDVAFLRKHTQIIELSDGLSRVAIAPAWQARVVTSTTNHESGPSFGWIKRDIIEEGIKPEDQRTGLRKHIHVFGGEERFWLGPEGGPFALFFPPKVPQTFDNWKTPALLDTDAFAPSGDPAPKSARFQKEASLTNRAGTTFNLGIERSIRLLTSADVSAALKIPVLQDIRAVGYETANLVKNTGTNAWTKDTGAPSIWLLGMFPPSPRTTVVIPLRDEPGAPAPNTHYLGFDPIPGDRVKVSGNTLFFKGDGKVRGKLGVAEARGKGMAGSWQADTGVLTIVLMPDPALTKNGQAPVYVDSQWKEDGDPFAGDQINSYNDGPPEPGAAALGPFYELETSSPALFLAPGVSHTHTQVTIHLTGDRKALDNVARRTLGAGLDAIEAALP
jgi:hypothetical protein